MTADFAAYVMYVNRPELLKRAVEAFPATWPELTVIDNSGYGVDTDLPDSVTIYHPPVPLTYSQSVNWMMQDAIRRHARIVLHFHSDATTTNPAAVSELLTYARSALNLGKRHASWWTFYDILWAINPAAFFDIGGADTMFRDYFFDQDWKRRCKLRGWETIDTHIQGMSHEGSATINSDDRLKFINGVTFKWYSAMYHEKWGGPPGGEVFLTPFDRPDLFADMRPYGGVTL